MQGVGYTSVDYGNAYRFNGGPGGIVPHADRETGRSRVVRVVESAERNQAGRNARGALQDDLDRHQPRADEQRKNRNRPPAPPLDMTPPGAKQLRFGASLTFQAQQIAQGDITLTPSAPGESTTRENGAAQTDQLPAHTQRPVADFTASQAYQDTADMSVVTILPPLPDNVELPTLV